MHTATFPGAGHFSLTSKDWKPDWASVAAEVRPSANKHPDGTLKPFYLKREFKYLDGDRFELSIADEGYEVTPLFNLIKSLPASLRYEPGLIMAEGDHVMIHARFRGEHRPVNWIGVDILRIADGVPAEHGDVLQDEATRAESKSGLPMFGDQFLA